MKQSFDEFMEQLSVTNSTLDFFVDFDKVTRNVEKISVRLNQLNYLIGKEDLRGAIEEVFEENPKSFSVLNILIAVRDNRPVLDDKGCVVDLNSYFKTIDSVFEFVNETGLAEIFRNKQIKNLVDYVFGIEVGLDTNARKNRGGKQMEKAVAKIFDFNEIQYREQVRHTEFAELTSLGEDVKQFDFVVQKERKTYLIEANFYNTSGSKLNEVARAYTDVAPKINQYENFEFVWITDGQGWLSAKNKLEEAYNNIPKIYNLTTIDNFIELIKS